MADLSLDAYIAKRNMKGGIGQRLGPKSPGGGRGKGRGNFNNKGIGRGRGKAQPQNTQFNVVGLGKFDARQKLSNNPLKTTIQDAREKIRGRTFDARQKLDSKNKKPVDVRQKIESMKAQKDARSKIKARKGNKGLEQKTPPGNTNAHMVSMARGSLTKTIRTSNTSATAQPGLPRNPGLPKNKPQTALTRTVNNEQPAYHMAQTGYRTRDYTNANLVITKKNLTVSKPTSQPSSSTIGLRAQRSPSKNWNSIQASMRQSSSISTVVKNDIYVEDDDIPEYEHVMLRSNSQPIQPSAVRAAIQKVSTRQTVPENQPTLHADSVGSLHGYRVLVTNLHPIVTEDDIVELFGAVGSLKKARLLKPGTAEVIFITKAEAQAAVRKYHLRELDGLPMRLALAPRAQENTPRPSADQPPPPTPTQPQAGGPLRLGRSGEAEPKPSTIDPTLIHRALFKTVARDEQPTRPVTFTVKI